MNVDTGQFAAITGQLADVTARLGQAEARLSQLAEVDAIMARARHADEYEDMLHRARGTLPVPKPKRRRARHLRVVGGGR